MKRGLIKEVMAQAKKVEMALESLPYRDALPALRALEEIRICVSDELPGGEYAECAVCEDAKGIDEVDCSGDETVCMDCIRRYAEQRN